MYTKLNQMPRKNLIWCIERKGYEGNRPRVLKCPSPRSVVSKLNYLSLWKDEYIPGLLVFFDRKRA